MIYAYKIDGDKSFECQFCDSQAEVPQGWYQSDTPINWSLKQYQNGAIVDRPQPQQQTYTPSAEEIKQQANDNIKAQIQTIEATQDRAVREAALGMAGAKERLQAIDSQIVVLRLQLQP